MSRSLPQPCPGTEAQSSRTAVLCDGDAGEDEDGADDARRREGALRSLRGESSTEQEILAAVSGGALAKAALGR